MRVNLFLWTSQPIPALTLKCLRLSRACTCRHFSARRPPTMSRNFGPTVVQDASNKHSASVIFLHGLGDTGSGISTIGQALVQNAPELGHIRFLFPTAPSRPVTMNGGMVMPAWFDLDLRKFDNVDNEGINEATSYLAELVAAEVKAGIPVDRIAIGGFSQGGHVSLKYLFKAQQPPAACIALSTWLEPNGSMQAPEGNKNVTIMIGHGTADPLLPLPFASGTKAMLAAKGFTNVDFRTYPGMQHSTCPQELADVRHFLTNVLPDRVPTREEVDAMSVKELKAFLRSRAIDTRSVLEKSELVSRAKAAL